jgi:hypothetical protein
MQPMLWSASKAAIARASSTLSAELSALSACGRLSLMMPTRPRVSTRWFHSSWFTLADASGLETHFAARIFRPATVA